MDYLDGSEDDLLHVMAGAGDRSAGSDELSAQITDWPSKYHLSPMRANLLQPLRLHPGLEVLDIGCGTGALTRSVAESGARVVGLEGSLARASVAAARVHGLSNARIAAGSLADFISQTPAGMPAKFDVIVVCGVLEYSGSGSGGAQGPAAMLSMVRSLLKPEGVLFLAIENRWGLKYLLSHPEDHLGQPWIGIEGYWRDTSGVRTWSRSELKEMLAGSGFEEQSWFAAYPDYKLPSALVHESMLRTVEGRRLVKQFVRTPTSDDAGEALRVADPAAALHSALDAGLGMELANSFVVMAGSAGSLEDHSEVGSVFLGAPARARAWRSTRRLLAGQGGWRLQVQDASGPSTSFPLRFQRSDASVVIGTNAEDLLAAELATGGFSSPGLRGILMRWWEEAQKHIRPGGDGTPVSFDLIPANFIVDDSGDWHFVDPEFEWDEPLAAEMVALRSMAWTAEHLCRRAGTIRGVAAGASVMTLAEGFCRRAGVTPSDRLSEDFLDFEAMLQAKVHGREDSEAVHAWRRHLAGLFSAATSDYLRTLPFLPMKMEVEQLTKRLARTESQLAIAESDLDSLRSRGEDLSNRNADLQRELAAVYASRRWRVSEAVRHPITAARHRVR